MMCVWCLWVFVYYFKNDQETAGPVSYFFVVSVETNGKDNGLLIFQLCGWVFITTIPLVVYFLSPPCFRLRPRWVFLYLYCCIIFCCVGGRWYDKLLQSSFSRLVGQAIHHAQRFFWYVNSNCWKVCDFCSAASVINSAVSCVVQW